MSLVASATLQSYTSSSSPLEASIAMSQWRSGCVPMPCAVAVVSDEHVSTFVHLYTVMVVPVFAAIQKSGLPEATSHTVRTLSMVVPDDARAVSGVPQAEPVQSSCFGVPV